MPITKVPIVHKFGIISHSQRLELQERLLKQSYLETIGTRRATTPSRNPLEVTEEFIQQFNAATTLDDSEKFEDLAYKMLERLKRRSGLNSGGQGVYVDLPVAWTELSQLAQCKGKIQEDCLDVLITSLDQSPLQRSHVPVLFFLAETTLYWLRTDAINQPYLRTGEIKLLKMGQLVFTRLFYHHMAGQLQGHREFKSRLFTYLDGFAESQDAYNPYPNALLSMRYIIEVGKIIIGDTNTDPGEVKEGDNIAVTSEKAASDGDSEFFHEVSAKFDGTQSSRSGAISSSVHDLSPTLWHSLDVWRCTNQLSGGLVEALKALAQCGTGLATESWVDGMCAMQVLADAAKGNMQALKVIQNLARGLVPKSPPSTTTQDLVVTDEGGSETLEESSDRESVLSSRSSHRSDKASLSDIFEKTEDDTSGRSGTSQQLGSSANSQSQPMSQPHESEDLERKSPPKVTGILKDPKVSSRGSPQKSTRGSQRVKTAGDSQVSDMAPATAWRAEAGTDLPSGRASEASSVLTYTNVAHPEVTGLHGWHWEVAITYADILADICLHGNTSQIQKIALVGSNKDVSDLHRRRERKHPMISAGLLDLVYFKAKSETSDGGPNDWSWRVRFEAMQSLVKVIRSCSKDPNMDGIRTVSWNTLLKAHSLEKDARVLEALKVGQVDTNIENMLTSHLNVSPSTIGNKIASGLSAIYLPPLPPPVELPTPRKKPQKPLPKVTRPRQQIPLRTSLREEIMVATALYEPAPSYNTRTTFDLRRIVEDQWRKELQQKLEEEEEERQKEIADQQTEEEKRLEDIEQQRKEKLGPKYKGPAYLYTNPADKANIASVHSRQDSRSLVSTGTRSDAT